MDLYKTYYVDVVDKRTSEWPLATSPLPLLTILAAYLMIILKWGPQYMENRKPFQLKTFLAFYNLFQVFACTGVISAIFYSGFSVQASFDCDTSKRSLLQARIVYCVYLIKLTELIETVCFVLRGKMNQVSNLHIYHHVSTAILCFFGLQYLNSNYVNFPIVLNSSVHVIMYTYYFLALFESTKSIGNLFKKYITIIQMVQFSILLAQAYVIIVAKPCEYPTLICVLYIPNVILIFYMFYDFYKKSYKSANKKSK